MYVRTMNIFTSHTVFAPMYKPWRLHAAWGTISPKTTMEMVDSAKPTKPSVRSAIKIAISEFTSVFPSKSVHKRRFPFARTGRICFAYSRSSSSPPSAKISSETMSRLISPSVRPLKSPERGEEDRDNDVRGGARNRRSIPTRYSIEIARGHEGGCDARRAVSAGGPDGFRCTHGDTPFDVRKGGRRG